MAKIENVTAREVLDSKGNPTIQAVVTVEGGWQGVAMVPAGTSTGGHEAYELRDGDTTRYGGKGVLKAVQFIRTEMYAALHGKDTANQTKIDRTMLELDGTPNKSRLGANAILAVSQACARVEAASQGLPLYLYLQQLFPKRQAVMPVPQMNLINGGVHASNGLSIQEYHVIPIGSSSFAEGLRMGVEIYHALRRILADNGYQVEVADEGGFAPKLDTSETAFTFLIKAIEEAGYVPGVDAFLGIDAAANEFFDKEKGLYTLDGMQLSANDLAYQYKMWRERYPVLSIEDPFHEDAWDDWEHFMKITAQGVQVIGDDLYVANATRIREGILRNATNAILIKPNQVGTVSETLQAILVGQEGGQNIVISHRSAETEDTFIADLAVAVGAGQIKTGAPSRSERTAKYNRLLQIADEIDAKPGHSLNVFLEKYKPAYSQATGVVPLKGKVV